MKNAQRARLVHAFQQLPPSVRSQPASSQDLDRFEHRFGPIPAPFKWFLTTCGGGPVGQDWIDDIAELFQTHKKFSAERTAGFWNDLVDPFVIGWDGAGNPIAIDKRDGRVMVADHNFGDTHELASSFLDLLESRLLDGAK